MNVFNKVTLQSLKKNKTRTIVTVIGIILSAAMICAVTTFASSFMDYGRQTTVYYEGNWHGFVWDTEFDTHAQIQNTGKVEQAVFLQQLGYAYAEDCENEFKPYIYVLGAGKNVEQVLPIHITSGKFPTDQTQILLPNHLYSNGGVKYSLGDTVTLELGQRMLDGYPMTQNDPCYIYEQGDEVFNGEGLEVKETRSYTVVGFYERMSYTIEPSTAPGYTALTVADKEPRQPYRYDVYFRMEEPDQIYGFMKEQGLFGGTNTDLLMHSGTFAADGLSTVLYGLAAIVIGLIMFGSVALIYNAFSISVAERTRQFGLLSSIGATKKQLKRMVLFEALAVSLIGIPLGIIAGVGGIGVTLLLVGDKFRSMGFPIDMQLSVSPTAIAVAAAVALITVLISAWIPSKRATKVSAVEAIRQNLDVNTKGKQVKTSRLTYKLFGLSGMLAAKQYKRSRKKYRATVLSLFMSIVLFVSASSFTDYLMETVTSGFDPVGYDLSMIASGNKFETVTPQELLGRMRAATAVSGGAFTQECFVNVTVKTQFLTEEGNTFFNRSQSQGQDSGLRTAHACITFVDDDTFIALLKENGLNAQQYMDPEAPLAIAVDGAVKFNYDTQKYETTRFFKSGSIELVAKKEKKVPGYYCVGEIVDENDNTVVMYQKDYGSNAEGDEELFLKPGEAYNYISLNVGSTVYKKPFFANNSYAVRVVYPYSLAQSVFEDYDATESSFHYMLISRNHTESYPAVQAVMADNGFEPKTLSNIAEAEESERNILTIIQVFSYGFTVLISLIAAANVFNTISTNISLRRREFAVLKSVGMSRRGLHKMMNYECLLYGSRALLYGLPASCVITYLIYRTVLEGFETTFQLPWTAIGIASLSVFMVVFATMLYSVRKIRKDNPIDALKNENL